MASIHEEALVAERDRRPLISWGAVFAGLALVVAATWLLFLLGSAIGVSVADASDLDAMGRGFGIGATVWMLLTAFLAFFLGSLLTARLSGKPEHTIGMLHGITLWSVGTVLMLVLGAWGVRGLIQTGTAAVGTVVSAGTSVGAAGAEGAQAGAGDLADSPLMTTIQARIKREIAGVLADAQRAERGQQPAVADGTPAASQQEIRRALDEIDADTLLAVAEPIIAGEPERGKYVLAVNTNLSEREIDTIVDGVSQEMSQQIDEAQQQVEEAVETVSTYTQAVMWIAFVASALALVVAIAGGWVGAGTVRRLYAIDVSRKTTV
ncbi:MAG TPA: hypothetical protein VMN03_03320 [Burkholderiales bacterium]|nr:hypothetical protein [Burkholderiales bacterium]